MKYNSLAFSPDLPTGRQVVMESPRLRGLKWIVGQLLIDEQKPGFKIVSYNGLQNNSKKGHKVASQ